MNKKLIIIVAVIIAVCGGVGAFLALNHTSKKDNQGSNTSSSVKTPDFNAVLTALKTKYPTIKDTYVYSENRDPNDNLGKAGFYLAGAEFYDTRTNTEPDVEAFGADSGGAIEAYANTSDAAKRVKYLKGFQGDSFLDPGAFKQVGKVVVRASSKYKGSEQSEMIDYLASLVH